ncbi:MAG: hypothetical protein ABFD91_09530, partial [Anaerohalosphaeraceae bacterium]
METQKKDWGIWMTVVAIILGTLTYPVLGMRYDWDGGSTTDPTDWEDVTNWAVFGGMDPSDLPDTGDFVVIDSSFTAGVISNGTKGTVDIGSIHCETTLQITGGTFKVEDRSSLP